jgi:AraC-like DNA-binding protein
MGAGSLGIRDDHPDLRAVPPGIRDRPVKLGAMVGRRKRRPARLAEEHFVFAFASGRARMRSFDSFHRHDEIELGFLERGSFTQLIDGRTTSFPQRRLVVFWGAIPHWHRCDNPDTIVHWLTVPLAWFLAWQLPPAFTRSLLDGRMLCEDDERRAPADLERFTQWHADLRDGSPESRKLVLLEVEARLRRLAAAQGQAERGPGAGRAEPASRHLGAVERMAGFVARRFRERLRVAEVAAHVGLHPDYASAQFKRAFGVGLGDYITQQRIAHAQQLLALTDAGVIDIALASGFASPSRFYDAFARICGKPPRAYRAAVRGGRELGDASLPPGER